MSHLHCYEKNYVFVTNNLAIVCLHWSLSSIIVVDHSTIHCVFVYDDRDKGQGLLFVSTGSLNSLLISSKMSRCTSPLFKSVHASSTNVTCFSSRPNVLFIQGIST